MKCNRKTIRKKEKIKKAKRKKEGRKEGKKERKKDRPSVRPSISTLVRNPFLFGRTRLIYWELEQQKKKIHLTYSSSL